MNPEDRLAQALHSSLDSRQPSSDLAERIAERVARTSRHRVSRNLRLAFAGAFALAIAAALVPLGLRWTAAPATAPATGLTHFDRDGLAFDYPASWKTSVSGFNMHYVTILDFLGTGSGTANCKTTTPGPGDQFTESQECGADLTVGPGQVVVTLSSSDGPPRSGPIDPNDPNGIGPGGTYVTVGGLPAVFDGQSQSVSADVALSWTLSVPGQLMSRYVVQADIKGPGVDQMRAQVEALVASIRYSPPVPVLDPADGPRIAAIGLAQIKSWGPEYACFPSQTGETATATITQFPGYSSLQRPLPVTCETAIEPEAIGLWKMTLTESWTAASDRSTGSLATTVWLDPDGTPGMTQGGGHSEIPYWP